MHAKEKELLVVAAALGLFAGSAGAGIIGYWSFNTNDGDLYTWPADMSSGTLALETGWTNLSTAPGSDLNAQWGYPAGDALELRGSGNNGRTADFLVDTTAYQDLVFSFDIERNNPGFGANQIWYSVDGGNFHHYSNFAPETSFSTVVFDLSALTELNYAAEVVLQIRFNGASNNGGRNRIDNVLIEGQSFVPAPGTIALLGLAGFRRRRRR